MTRVSIFCLLCFCLSFPVFSQDLQIEQTIDIDWSNPETIDPLQEDVSDLLDIDPSIYMRNAYNNYYSGNYEEAAKYFLAYLRYNIFDANSIYNLACCYGQLGKDSLAAKFLKRAVKTGLLDIEYMKWDPNFNKVRGKKVFDNAVDSITKWIEELGDIIYVEATKLHKCRVRLPEGYNINKTYPLVIGLHGYTDNADRFITLWEKFDQPEFIFAVPQAPYKVSGFREARSWRITGSRGTLFAKSTQISGDYVAEVVSELSDHYNINKVYLFGFSQGAAFTYIAGIKNHHLFEGLICFGGWLDTDLLAEEVVRAGKDLKIFIGHGLEDDQIEYKRGSVAKIVLEKYGYDVTLRNFDGGHTVPEEVLNQAVEWMKYE